METQNKSRNTPIISLPAEIILEEILPRFPVKSLLRFRCVSKSWRSLIDSEQFIKIQHEISIKDASLLKQSVVLEGIRHHLPKQCSLQSLLSGKTITPSPLDDPIPTDASSKPFQVLGCFNGLLCIRTCRGKFYLWNPSTRICKKLPGTAKRLHRVENCGFGWDESSGEYKVFAVFVLLRHPVWDINSNYRSRVYSSKTKSWKTIEYNYNLTYLPNCVDMVGVFVGGKLHWKGKGNCNYIIFLDLKSEVFGWIEKPYDKRDRYYERLGQIGGCLCVLYDHCDSHRRDIQVWVMKESWERLWGISLDHELLQRPFSASSFTHKGSNGEIFVFDGPTLLVYDPRENEFRYPELCCMYISRHVYVESLLSPEDV